jgi:TRAP-type C4-dicarboxylate transport system permease small subunit
MSPPVQPAPASLARAEKALDALAVVLFALMFAVIMLQITLRYVFNRPLVFSDELATYFFVWISFLGWTMATRRRVHIGIGVIADRLPPLGRRWLHAAWCVATVLFALALLAIGIAAVRRNADVQMVSIDFALWPVYLVVPLAALFLLAYAVRDFIVVLRHRDVRATEASL